MSGSRAFVLASLLPKPSMSVGIVLTCSQRVWIICTIVYSLFFHPLCKFPGPRIAAISPWWLKLTYYKTATEGSQNAV